MGNEFRGSSQIAITLTQFGEIEHSVWPIARETIQTNDHFLEGREGRRIEGGGGGGERREGGGERGGSREQGGKERKKEEERNEREREKKRAVQGLGGCKVVGLTTTFR